MLNHIDLFTGIGGFTLACHWNGIDTEVMCEKDKRCQDFLRKTWPGIPIVGDIRDFDGSEWAGAFILTGGVPCQPASRAGKQRGKDDDRWLWPEAIRVVDEAKPRWCLFENPPGIYDVGLDGILSDLEGIGYEVGICEIPACAVNSPQIRQRVWIVANAVSSGSDREAISVCGEKSGKVSMSTRASQGDMADTCSQRHQERVMHPGIPRKKRQREQGKAVDMGGKINMADPQRTERMERDNSSRQQERSYPKPSGTGFWDRSIWTSCADGKFRRTPDDSFGLVDGLHRSVLAALGNTINPYVAYEIIKAICFKGLI